MIKHMLDNFLKHNPISTEKIVASYEWGLGVLRIDLDDERTILWDDIKETARIYLPGALDVRDTNLVHSEFSVCFRILIRNYGKTVDEISKKSGLSKTIIYRYLAGDSEPTYKNIILLSKALGCAPNDFFRSVREFDFVN